jgi:hypothetical protein
MPAGVIGLPVVVAEIVGPGYTLARCYRRDSMTRHRQGTHAPLKGDSLSIPKRTRPDATAFWTALSSIAACLAALFAGWAALETRYSALEANRATKAVVWLQLLNEYEAPEMLSSMKELRAWQQQDPNNFADAFEKLLLKSRKTDQEERLVEALDLDRRRVSGFFINIQTLCQGGIIDERFAKDAFGGSTYRFLIDVVVPMENAKAEAMIKTNSFSAEDKAAADKREKELLQFYARVLH